MSREYWYEGDFYGMECCGVKEYYGINDGVFSDVRDIAMQFEFDSNYNYLNACHVLINEVVEDSYGPGDRIAQFEALCRENGLGTVVHTRMKQNPNSGNRIRSAIWTPARRALGTWARQQPEYQSAEARYHESQRRWVGEIRW